MITLTELAAKEVKSIVARKQEASQKNGDDPTPQYLRIGVKGGGCSGFSYTLDVTESKTDQDESYSQHGIEVICDSRSLNYIEGVTVDFKDEMMERGFVFSNPNATSSCGCGSSFSV